MKLTVINEVFDKPSLEGVDIREVDNTFEYRFDDTNNGYEYQVTIYYYTVENMEESESEHAMDDVLDTEALKDHMKIYDVIMANINLEAKSPKQRFGSPQLTGVGNQWFVYGKMLACVQHFIGEYKPAFLEFEGANSYMDLMYDKLMKLMNKMYPSDSYTHFRSSFYIRKELASKIGNFEKYRKNQEEYRQEYLEKVRKRKIESRKSKIERDSN